MKGKMVTLVALFVFAVTMLIPCVTVSADPPSVLKKPITASGQLVSGSTLEISYLNGSQLTFNSTGALVVTAPATVKVAFNDSSQGYQTLIVSTDNKRTGLYTNTNATMTGAGLVGSTDSTVAVPLHWVVFPTASDASSYTFTTFTAADQAGNSAYVEGYVDNRKQPFVVDRSQSNFNTAAVISYCNVIYGIDAGFANLASVPVAGTGGNARTVSNGEVYMKFAVDFHGGTSQAYTTNTLTLDMITIS